MCNFRFAIPSTRRAGKKRFHVVETLFTSDEILYNTYISKLEYLNLCHSSLSMAFY